MRVNLAQWLRDRELVLIPAWIRAVRAKGDQRIRHLPTKELGRQHFLALFDTLVTAAETGDYAPLDALIEKMVHDRLRLRYDLEHIILLPQQLREVVWNELIATHSPQEALAFIREAEPLFDHIITKLVRTFTEASTSLLRKLSQDLERRVQERTEELARLNRELERVDKAKSDFIRIAAHELRTPLTLIHGYASILAEEPLLQREKRIRDFVKGITRGVERLESIVKDLVDASRIDIEAFTIHRGPTFLNQIIRLALQELQPALKERRHTLFVEGLDDLPPIEGDSQRLYQVFINVISNAIKYTPDGGRITIKGRYLPDDKGIGADYVEIVVADTGIGIPKEELERIFDKFYRLGDVKHYSTSKTRFKGGGPGLGLAIAKGVVEAHGGKIWAESEGYDEERCPGSRFHILLPVKAVFGKLQLPSEG